MPQDAIIQLTTRLVYENRWLRLREDRVRRTDGSEGIYSVLERAEFAVIAPIQDGMVHLVEQFRYPVRARCWEFPMGTWETRTDVDPLDLAAGELREETGLRAGTLTEIGTLFQAAGYSSQVGRAFFATDLTPVGHALEHEEQDMVTGAFPVAEFEAMIRDGVIRDVITIAVYGMLKIRGLL
jgi:8-oxo-dGTP pyrophosphatase MutT (NUDIX family)